MITAGEYLHTGEKQIYSSTIESEIWKSEKFFDSHLLQSEGREDQIQDLSVAEFQNRVNSQSWKFYYANVRDMIGDRWVPETWDTGISNLFLNFTLPLS